VNMLYRPYSKILRTPRVSKRATQSSVEYSKLEPRAMLAVVISEFVASNTNSFEDGFGSKPDWIELHNTGDTPVDLNGYTLTDDPSDPTAWTFEGPTTLQANEYLVVFASGDDLVDPAGYQHTNFRLSAGGEYLGLYDPSGTLLSSFGDNGADYPPQVTDISYGLFGGTLIDSDSPSFLLAPNNSAIDNVWRNVNFNATANGFSTSTSAIGYENNPSSITSYSNEFTTPVASGETSVYLRTEFEISDASAVNDLLLELKYDDGFAAFLNGTLVAQQNAPNALTFNSIATSDHYDGNALQYTPFNLDNRTNLLQDGTNVLAIHALNRPGSSDFLLVPRLTSSLPSGDASYLSTTTPGFANSGVASLGPEIESVTQNGVSVDPNQPLVISASVSDLVVCDCVRYCWE